MQGCLFYPQGPGAATGGNRLVGIARLAAQSETIDAKAQVEYLALPTRSILNRCDAKRMPFDYTINPYRGCEFGCKYCYARYTHEYLELDGALFENRIYAKQHAADIFRAELKKAGNAPVAIGTATDPYQPAERRYRITRQILEVIAEQARGGSFSLVTKSDLVTRDIDLFQVIARHNEFQANLTITTLNAPLARALEPRAPRPVLRLAAVRALSDAGIRVGVYAAPVLPAITDNPKNLEEIARESVQAGARYFLANPLFLMPCAQKQFFPFLEKQFPHLLESYRKKYERGAFLRGDYPQRLQALVDRLRKKYGLAPAPREYAPDTPREAPVQRALF